MKCEDKTNVDRVLASHPSRGAWIEIFIPTFDKSGIGSHPSRGAWIEIESAASAASRVKVAPLAGCVD